MQYEPGSKREMTEIARDFESNDRDTVVKALVDSINSIDDYESLLSHYMKLITRADFWIAKTALNCISDLARIFPDRMMADKRKVTTTLLTLKESREDLLAIVEETLEDIEIFIG